VTQPLPASASTLRADIVECWLFRARGGEAVEVLLMRRSPGRIFEGLWQPVTGRPEPDELAPLTALREVAEETGVGPADRLALYTLDQVVQLYGHRSNAIVHAVVFALRVRPKAIVRLSDEHDDYRWVPAATAPDLAIWPAYRESLARIERLAADPGYARWFELDAEGRRIAG
jgi:8-oxo-dGTP pyrophosphatase MutT (NUDIX family)